MYPVYDHAVVDLVNVLVVLDHNDLQHVLDEVARRTGLRARRSALIQTYPASA